MEHVSLSFINNVMMMMMMMMIIIIIIIIKATIEWVHNYTSKYARK